MSINFSSLATYAVTDNNTGESFTAPGYDVEAQLAELFQANIAAADAQTAQEMRAAISEWHTNLDYLGLSVEITN